MTAIANIEWHSLLPLEIIHRSYRSGCELAWARSDALGVVNFLQIKGFRILGVDIWLPTEPGPTIPTPFVYDWNERYPLSALDFIQTFEWDKTDRSHLGMAPYFNITAV